MYSLVSSTAVSTVFRSARPLTRLMASIVASPPSGLMCEKVDITVAGLDKEQPVTLSATVQARDERDRESMLQFHSHAHYITDSTGSVVCSRHAASGGTFSGVQPMGLFWSLQPDKKGTRLVPRDVTQQLAVELQVHDGHNNGTSQQEPIARCVVERGFMGEGVTRTVVREGRVRGVLFLPKGKGPFPGVIGLYGSHNILEHRAALLASQGFAAFRLMFSAFEDLPKGEKYLDSDYFEQAVDWFSAHPQVQPGGVGVVGLSLGGTLALIMGTLTDKINAVVCLNGNTAMLPPSEFNYRGEILPTVGYDLSRGKLMEEGYLDVSGIMNDPEPDICIKVEHIQCPILFIAGEADTNWKSAKLAKQAIARLQAHGKTNYELLTYPGTGHVLEPPYMPHCKIAYHPGPGTLTDYGGETQAHCAAQEDLWPRMIQFLRKCRRHSRL